MMLLISPPLLHFNFFNSADGFLTCRVFRLFVVLSVTNSSPTVERELPRARILLCS